ncbi:MAG: protein translocase subunit SecD [Candidatus Zixiibacteriota bacterium]
MRRTKKWVIFLILILVLASFFYLLPSAQYWSLSDSEKEGLRIEDPQKLLGLEKRAIKLGLDLKGGMHVVLQVDRSKLNQEERKDAVERALEIIRNRVDQFGVTEPLIQKQGDDRIIVELPGLVDAERASELIGKTALMEYKLLPEPEIINSLIKEIDRVLVEAKPESLSEVKEKKEEEPIEDLFATGEKDTFALEEKDTLDDFLGELDEEPLEEDRPFSSLLEPSQSFFFYVPKEEMAKVNYLLDKPEVKRLIPDDLEFAWATKTQLVQGMEYQKLYILKKRVEFSGQYLTDAKPRYDEFRSPYVHFTLTKRGGRKFAQLTGANIEKPLAIVLDGRVESAPIIQDKVREEGRITMGGGSTWEDAYDLSIILRAGALPAPVKIAENRVIGPSLGQDSVKKGTLAAMIGLAIVLIFMFIYYRISGLIADFALFFNLFFLLAAMAALHATLTMPGIAGIILIVGMSVDANVLIFERIREELRTGKTVRASIDAGYKRALLTIVDSHVTTLITALVLFQFGTGPIKGFAVSLSMGVVISLFTAVVITKSIFDMRKGYKTLSI